MTTITIDRAVVKQALEALEAGLDVNPILAGEAEEALRAALAQQAEPVQEPVAWYQKRGQEVLTSHPACWGREDEPWKPLYTAPPQRKPLTEEEIESCRQKGYAHAGLGAPFDFGKAARAVERALEEKNCGR